MIQDQNKRSQVKKAISVRRALAFLKDFKDTIYLGKVKLSQQDLEHLATIEHYLYNPKEGLSGLEKIGKDIDDLFVTVQQMRG